MGIELLKEQFLTPQRKIWVRVVESFFALLPAWTSIILHFSLKAPVDIYLLKLAYWSSILACPFIAFLMYRNSDLTKIERLAILGIMISASFAIMVASIENQNI